MHKLRNERFLLVCFSVRSKQVLCFVHGQGKSEEIYNKELSSFMTIPLYHRGCFLTRATLPDPHLALFLYGFGRKIISGSSGSFKNFIQGLHGQLISVESDGAAFS